MRPSRTAIRLGACLFWPLLLVGVLVVLTAVDADGDPLTPNFPPIVLETSAAIRNAPRIAVRSRKTQSRDLTRHLRLGRVVDRWRNAIRETRFVTVRPIRGP